MTDLTGLRLAVAGGGVFGLCVALRASVAGAQVQLWDPAPLGDNASGVAAGMIAPVGEALFDHLGADDLRRLRAGRDGWSAFKEMAPGLVIDHAGAVFLFENQAALLSAQSALSAIGAEVEAAPSGDYALPWVLRTPEDWRLQPVAALAALQAAAVANGVVFHPAALDAAHLAAFDAVVLAAGIQSRSFAGLAPELGALRPIKGQIVRFQGRTSGGPTLRTAGLYIVPQGDVTLAGATMEAGRADRIVEPSVIADLRAAAVRLAPGLEAMPYQGLAGVRAAAPDGWPLVGPSRRPGLHLAVGARRNGWLLAPLVSQIVVSYLSGGDGGPYAAAFHPGRFLRA